MTINYKLPPVWMERSGEGYSCICPQCGTICRTVNPTGTSAEIFCNECGSAFRIEYLRFVTEETKKISEKSEKVNESQIDFLKSCPFCNSQNLTKYRFNIGGFLDKDGCTETICENGDTFRIECDCGCKFDKCQDELFDKAEGIYTYDGKYGVEITDADLWNVMIADWNRRE